jgi:hypothetical protein
VNTQEPARFANRARCRVLTDDRDQGMAATRCAVQSRCLQFNALTSAVRTCNSICNPLCNRQFPDPLTPAVTGSSFPGRFQTPRGYSKSRAHAVSGPGFPVHSQFRLRQARYRSA